MKNEVETATVVRLSDVPVKMLRSFCVQQKYGIRSLSTLTKDNLLVTLAGVDPQAEEKIQEWLKQHSNYKIESLPGGGRRITEVYVDGVKRVYEEDANGNHCVRYEPVPLQMKEIHDLPEAKALRAAALKYAQDRKADLWREKAEQALYEAAVALATVLVKQS